MGFQKFDSKDLIYNQIETNPKFIFTVHNSNVYFQNERSIPGSFLDAGEGGDPDNLIKHIPQGSVSLHEINVNRPGTDGTLVTPFITVPVYHLEIFQLLFSMTFPSLIMVTLWLDLTLCLQV